MTSGRDSRRKRARQNVPLIRGGVRFVERSAKLLPYVAWSVLGFRREHVHVLHACERVCANLADGTGL